MKLNFQQEVLTLPGSVLTHCGEADAETLRVLLWLSSDLSLADKPRQLAKLSECDPKTVKAALQFWQFRDVLAEENRESVSVMATAADSADAVSARHDRQSEKQPEERRVPLRRADELPNYTSAELADLMEQRAAIRVLVDEAQRILGKMFNPNDINILIGLVDYLGMSEECILLLLAYCKRIDRPNLRYIEKTALSLADRGIITAEAMEEEIRVAETLKSFSGEVRTLFGMNKTRELTSKESKMISAWVSFGYDIEIVRMAYEVNVNAKNEPSLPYTNAILERWHAEGLKTATQIQEHLAAEKSKREGGTPNSGTILGNSFDTDDFFEAALRRGFNERREN